MDTFSSGEDLFMKTRKPYTITKQRERWTDEEHNRFIEALKLYGRAWQRIEDHIGTKTAVQIRSHAQKFFTKLEKEALLKGIPTGQALEIDIPPPRPKRKPSNPYPRKTGVGAPFRQVEAEAEKSSTPVSSLCPGKQILDLEGEPLSEQPGGDQKPGNAKENQDENTCAETLTLSSANETSMATKSLHTFWEYVPVMKEASSLDETNESHVTFEPEGNQKLVKLDAKQTVHNNETDSNSNVQSSKPSHEKLIQGHKTDQTRQPGDFGELPSNDTQATQTYPRHVPVHVLDRCLLMSIQNVPANMPHQESIFHQVGGLQGHPNLSTYPGASSTTGPDIKASRPIPQSFPPFHPLFTPPCTNEDDYQAYCHGYSTFSSLIVSTLLQNPAAHAAASLAATFLPGANMEASVDSPAGILGGFPSRQVNPAPSMAAIAAATVAAANAWWAAHGLLPSCTPFCSCFTCAPAPATVTSTGNGLTPASNTDKDLLSQSQQPDPELSVSLQGNQPGSKLPILSSEDSEEIGGKPNTESSAAGTKKAAAVTELRDPEKKSRKPVDRSSCGSNTASSSEVETDALEKHEKDEEDLIKEPDVSHPDNDSNSHRCRSSSQANDSWKEVSQEGRLAFQALFSRGILPQSFSPPHYLKSKSCQNNIEKDNHNASEKTEDASELDLHSMTWGTFSIHQAVEHNTRSKGNNIGEEGILTVGLGRGKLKSRRTGFKPYKRCSVEANESWVGSTSNQGDEKGPKRIRLEGEAAS